MNEFIFVLFLERLNGNLNGVKVLLSNYQDELEHSLGLILRNILTDFFILSYLSKSNIKDDELENKIIALFYSDYIKNESNKKLLANTPFASSNESSNTSKLEVDKDRLSKFIIEEFNKRKLKKFPNTAKLIIITKEEGFKSNWDRYIIKAYDLWLFYSKYEHISMSYYNFVRLINPSNKSANIKASIEIAYIMVASCLTYLNEKDLSEKVFDRLNKFIENQK